MSKRQTKTSALGDAGLTRSVQCGDAARADAPCVIGAEADMTSCDRVRQLFMRCRHAAGNGSRSMLIDLRKVQAADTKLMACLVVVYRLAKSNSIRLEFSPSSAVRNLAEVCRLDWLIERTAPTG